MSIIYDAQKRTFELCGGDVSYVLHIDENGTLMNLYWGKRIPLGSIQPQLEPYSTNVLYSLPAGRIPYELPVRGACLYGTPAIAVRNLKGDDMVQPEYVSHAIYGGKKPLTGLPATYVEDESEADSLEIVLRDPLTGLTVKAQYCVYTATGAITRSMHIVNEGTDDVRITGAMAASVLLYGHDYEMIHLKGAWARERDVVRASVGRSENRICSQLGASGHEQNPFIALCTPKTTEHTGEVWAMNLVYSGSFQAHATVDLFGNTRLGIGMNPDTFEWLLRPGEHFQTPEAVLVYAADGLNGMSHVFHALYRTRLIRSAWRDRVRPILVNNWEATYFDFTPEKIMPIVEKAKELGIEMFVLDDGWFGKRNNDDCSLGDWVVNRQKLPGGIEGLAKQIKDKGMMFGLWFEPEMVSPDSDLYRQHPDWCLHIDGRKRTEARNQLILDLSRTEVQEYIVQAVSSVLRSAPIDYVKWDMNRNMTEAFSGVQKAERQMETQHRYMLGLYHVIDTITSAFPDILFESCSGGGGRFDAGMLHYMPQTWTSDDTDAVERLMIQYGTSFVYPASAMGAHVSAVPNHQTGRTTSMKMRCEVAAGGNFGFELDLSKLSDEDLNTAKSYVSKVKQHRELTQRGVFSRLLSPFEGEYTAWQFVSESKDEALLCAYRVLSRVQTLPLRVRMCGLDADANYVDEDGRQYNGALLMNMGMWIDLRQDFSSRVIHLRKFS